MSKQGLNDFKLNSDGRYIYEGKLYSFDGDGSERKRYLAKVFLFSAAMLVSSAVSRILPVLKRPEGVFDFVVLPWILQFSVALFTFYTVIKLVSAENPLRDYKYVKTVKRLPGLSFAGIVTSTVTVLTWIVYLLIFGFDRSEFLRAALCPAGSIVCLAFSLVLRVATVTERWKYGADLVDEDFSANSRNSFAESPWTTIVACTIFRKLSTPSDLA